MEGYIDALQLTVIALMALLLISFCFVGLSRGLTWGAGAGRRVKGGPKEARRKVIIAAAVRSYLDRSGKR